MPPPVQVAIINDFDMVVRGLAAVLDQADGIDLIDIALDPTAWRTTTADVLLVDTYAHPDAITWVHDITASSPAQVLVFSWAPHPPPETTSTPTSARYLSKMATRNELVAALRDVANGTPPQPASLAAATEAAIDPVGAWPGKEHGLSGRESEIIALVARGLNNPEIAAELFISINTVKTYIRTGYRKIDVTRRSQAVRWAMLNGLVPPTVSRR